MTVLDDPRATTDDGDRLPQAGPPERVRPAGRRSFAERAASFLERRVDRRGVLRKGAMAGTAMAVAPTTYVLRPGSAYAAVCAPGSLCLDGYTEFCCTIYGANRCPAGTSLGGWWKVDGSSYCGGGPRYYMDCNAACNGCGCGGNGVCSGTCSGTACGCANGDCNNRKAGCTAFRYGQCNQGTKCLGPIVCRVVTCTEPWRIDGTCTTASRTDNATRYHSRPCLEVDAIGAVDGLYAVPGGVRVSGWAIDPSAAGAAVTVNVYDCLRPIGSLLASNPRGDVDATFPGQGPNHGFDAFFRLCPGDRLISVAAVDTSGRGSNWISHQMVHIDANPVGHFDSVSATAGRIRVVGFVIDPDAVNPTPVDVIVDGNVVGRTSANVFRGDVAATFPYLGGNYGFDVTVPAGPGAHNVCIIARNAGGGSDVDLGCRPVTVPADPTGALESVTSPGPGTLRLIGYAHDNDTSSPLQVRVTVDGATVNTYAANQPRGDVWNGYGFDLTIPGITPGARTVCVTALNVGGGSDVQLGCANLAVAAVAAGQVTALDAVSGGVRLATTPITRTDGEPASVRVLVDGQFRASLRSGPAGLDTVLPLPPGDHEVVVVATVDGPRTIPPVLATATVTVAP
jgi:hypothetical protein